MIPGDANSGVFVGFPAVGNDPFVAVERGYEIQIDPTDNPASTTGAIYSFQAADRARRDQALRPPGEWNTYEITVDAPRIVVRLNGVVVNRFVSTSAARQSLGRGFVGLQNHSDADRVSFRSVQVKEWGGERPRCAGATRAHPGDAFSGARLDGCRWNRIVRYDGGGLRRERRGAAPRAHRRRHPRPATRSRQPRAPACAGRRVDDRDDRARPAPLGLAAGGPARVPRRRRLRQARRGGGGRRQGPVPAAARPDAVARTLRCVAARPRSDTYRLRLARSGSRYTGFWSLDGASWRRLGSVVNTQARRRGFLRPGRARAGSPGAAALRGVRALSRPAVERAGGAASRRPRL